VTNDPSRPPGVLVIVRASALITLTCLTAACYDYVPLATLTPEPRSHVAVTLSEPGSRGLASKLGPDVSVVRGRYLRADEQGLLISVSSVVTQRGRELDWAGESVVLPTDAITSIQLRQLAKSRSALLVGVGVSSVVAAAAGFGLVGGGSQPGGGPGGPGPR
jgi:hypothetical protein